MNGTIRLLSTVALAAAGSFAQAQAQAPAWVQNTDFAIQRCGTSAAADASVAALHRQAEASLADALRTAGISGTHAASLTPLTASVGCSGQDVATYRFSVSGTGGAWAGEVDVRLEPVATTRVAGLGSELARHFGTESRRASLR